jgi:hypothetical protein
MLTRRNVLKWAAGLFASFPFMKGMTKEAVSNKNYGMAGIVICETPSTFKFEVRKAQTMNEFTKIGHQILPEATRISVVFSETRYNAPNRYILYVLLDGPGTEWKVLNGVAIS